MRRRKYTLRGRAEKRDRTRERIVDALMALHEEVGPAATTISAVADRAGVQRLTVYRHFPSEKDLFFACTSKWIHQHPPPEIAEITHEDPAERTRLALRSLYRYYRATEGMWTSVYRDVDKVPAMAEPMSHFEAYVDAFAASLLKSWAPYRSKQLKATLSHAVRFSTWRSLSSDLGDTAMADLVGNWARAATNNARRQLISSVSGCCANQPNQNAR